MVPPEALAGHAAFDLTWDIYQMGLTLYRMCVGNVEFYRQFNIYTNEAAFVADVLSGKFPDRKKYPAHIPSRLRNVIKKCLKVLPAERYQSAIEVANALATIDGYELDWQLTEAGGNLIWTKCDSGGVTITLELDPNGNAKCSKRTASGNERRIKAMCGAVTERDIVKFLGET